MRIDNSIDIAAPAERVWALTLDVESLPAITPTVNTVERLDTGPVRVGSKARLRQPGQGARVWTVTELEPNHRFAWSTSILGVAMTGIHVLTPTPGGTRNTLSIEIEGATAKVLGPLLRRQIARAIATENEGFRRHAESMQPTTNS